MSSDERPEPTPPQQAEEPGGAEGPEGPEEVVDAVEPVEPLPEPDGLELARAMARAVAGSAAAPARRSGSRSPDRGRNRSGGRVSGAHPDDRDPQLLDATLARVVGDHGWELSLRVHGVFGRWAEIVGPEISAHSTPESFADGKLVVRTDSTAWSRELSYQVQGLLRRLNEELGHGTVTVIEVLGPQGPTWKKGPRSVRGRGPRDTYG